MKRKFIKAEFIEKDIVNGTFTAVASSATVDRHGEIVSPEGWDLTNFKKNPVLLWSHDHTIPAIGKATAVWVEGVGNQAKLMFKGAWQTVTEQGRAAAELVAEGILNSFSVGFLPEEMLGNTYTKQELLEISLVNVPANPDAMMLAYKSLKDKGFSERVAKEITQQFAGISDVRKDLFGKERGALQDELDAEAVWEAKCENMDELYEIFWAFCDVYYDENTPVTDFNPLLTEMIGLLQQIVAGTYQDPDASSDAEELEVGNEVIDKKNKNIKTVDNKAKVPESTAPRTPSQVIRNRQTLTKAIVKASDLLLADKKNSLSNDQSVKLVKVIKMAGEKLSQSHKGEINNG